MNRAAAKLMDAKVQLKRLKAKGGCADRRKKESLPSA
jgi:hypothetical protein